MMSFFFLLSWDITWQLAAREGRLAKISVPHSGNIWREERWNKIQKADMLLQSSKAELKTKIQDFLTHRVPRETGMWSHDFRWNEKNSQLAGCSPNRRINWSCVNFTKVSYCSEIYRTGYQELLLYNLMPNPKDNVHCWNKTWILSFPQSLDF